MKTRSYHYNAGGFAVNENGGFISLKSESVETLKHRRKLLYADKWRLAKVRPAQINNGTRPAEQMPDIEKSLSKSLKAIEKVNAELKTRK